MGHEVVKSFIDLLRENSEMLIQSFAWALIDTQDSKRCRKHSFYNVQLESTTATRILSLKQLVMNT